MFNDTIRIGTLVNGGPKTADYIRQILPHGFESFSITFWQKIGDGVDLKRMAREVKAVLADSDAVINSVSCFGNPLMNRPIDNDTRDGWPKLIGAAHFFGCDIVTAFPGRLIEKPIPA